GEGLCRIKKAYKRAASNDDGDISRLLAVKQKTPGRVSSEVSSYTEGIPPTWSEDDSPESSPQTERVPTSPEPAIFTPDDDMTSDVCDVIFEEVMGRKIIFECQSSRLSLETITHDMCQDVAATTMSSERQKEIRRQIRLIEPQLK
ncbi:hypothetical protein LSAT2_011641, partial [Lamellibrachia satsuma]